MEVDRLIGQIQKKQSELGAAEARYADGKAALEKIQAELMEKYGTADSVEINSRLRRAEQELADVTSVASAQLDKVGESLAG